MTYRKMIETRDENLKKLREFIPEISMFDVIVEQNESLLNGNLPEALDKIRESLEANLGCDIHPTEADMYIKAIMYATVDQEKLADIAMAMAIGDIDSNEILNAINEEIMTSFSKVIHIDEDTKRALVEFSNETIEKLIPNMY